MDKQTFDEAYDIHRKLVRIKYLARALRHKTDSGDICVIIPEELANEVFCKAAEDRIVTYLNEQKAILEKELESL